MEVFVFEIQCCKELGLWYVIVIVIMFENSGLIVIVIVIEGKVICNVILISITLLFSPVLC